MKLIEAGKHKGCVRGFVHTGESWYAGTALKPGVVDEVMFGFYCLEGGTTGEMQMRWANIGGEIVPELRAFNDAWHALAEFPDLLVSMAAVDDKNIGPKEFCKMLESCGFIDMTERIRDEQPWLQEGAAAPSDPVAADDPLYEELLAAPRDQRQERGLSWAIAAFGESAACNRNERFRRVVEEALELGQAGELAAEECHQLVDYVFSRPAGEIHQEVGGLGLSTLNLCQFLGLSADTEETRELARVLAKDPAYFHARQAAKAAAGVAVAPETPHPKG